MASENNDGDDYRGVFDLADADGVNKSERLLARLCRTSFLSLWAYPNLHTNEGFRDGRGSAKEFTDVLLVFGDDVVLFSDKHVDFNEDKTPEVAWARWYRRVWIAISVYVLVAIVKKRLSLPSSLYANLQILSLTLFERTPLDQLLTRTDTGPDSLLSRNQMNLFE